MKQGRGFRKQAFKEKSQLKAAVLQNNLSGLKRVLSQLFLHTNTPIDRAFSLGMRWSMHAAVGSLADPSRSLHLDTGLLAKWSLEVLVKAA